MVPSNSYSTALVIIFIVSFFPVGGYLLREPHWLRWIGISNLGFLVAGLMIMYSTRKATRQVSVNDQGDR
jgi:type VI protein secretion system component VasK